MAGLGWQELVIVLVIIMIIFGAGKLPEVARSLGQGVKEFKKESNAPIEPVTASATGASTTTTPNGPERVEEVVVTEKRELRADEV